MADAVMGFTIPATTKTNSSAPPTYEFAVTSFNQHLSSTHNSHLYCYRFFPT